ncbi:MAG TPA: hypothetical protein VHE33_07975 [Acidobacteriaceae bacterium]|nr:hypothetical protein [Acidobacteriaceae bacterium]
MPKITTRVKDLPGWMPRPIGLPSRFAPSDSDALGEATVEHILRVMDDRIVFTCKYKGRRIDFDFSTEDRKTSDKVAEILRSHREKSLASIGTIELPADLLAA